MADGHPCSHASRPGEEMVSRLVQLPLECLGKEFPWKLAEVQAGEMDAAPPRMRHPAFHGCFDWHSSVHSLWSLARSLRLSPGLPESARIVEILDERLTRQAIAAEMDFLEQAENRDFESPYGWAWLLALAAELSSLTSPCAATWQEAVYPLAEMLSKAIGDYFCRLSHPVRHGVHSNSAFSMALALDAAHTTGDAVLEERLLSRSRDFFAPDVRCPLRYEPSGTDFLSPCLAEADLMRRVLQRSEFGPWLAAFLDGDIPPPPRIDDPEDPICGHLIGLCFHRTWTLWGITSCMEEQDPRRMAFLRAAQEHETRGMNLLFRSGYQGTHWLATFALYCLSWDEPR